MALLDLDVESAKTIKESIDALHTAAIDIIDHAALKIDQVVRDSAAVLVGALRGWELEIPGVAIKLTKKEQA